MRHGGGNYGMLSQRPGLGAWIPFDGGCECHWRTIVAVGEGAIEVDGEGRDKDREGILLRRLLQSKIVQQSIIV